MALVLRARFAAAPSTRASIVLSALYGPSLWSAAGASRILGTRATPTGGDRRMARTVSRREPTAM